jgi:hypothetical protein
MTIDLAAEALDHGIDPESLGLTEEVVTYIRKSDGEQRDIAASSCMPLIQPHAVKLAQALRGEAEQVGGHLPEAMAQWHRQALLVLQRCFLVERELSVVWFDLPPKLADDLAQCTLKDLETISKNYNGLFSVRFGDQPRSWRRLLLSPQVGEQRAAMLAQMVVLTQAAI